MQGKGNIEFSSGEASQFWKVKPIFSSIRARDETPGLRAGIGCERMRSSRIQEESMQRVHSRRAWLSAVAILGAAILEISCGAPKPAGPNEYVIRVTDAGFEPAELLVPKATPITLVVTREVSETCATDLVIAGSGQSVPLPLRKSVRIPLPNGVADTLRYACAMDMFRGTVVAK
jgi:hypothetical protein